MKFHPIIQPKIKVGPVNDHHEQEADKMADQVLEMPQSDHVIQRQDTGDEEEQIQMKPLGDTISPMIQKREEEETLQMKSQGGENVVSTSFSNQLNQKKGNGKALSDNTNQFMSNAFGSDFSKVNIHTGADAIQMNRSLGARAFTHGSDVFFNEGEYNPSSNTGKHLLAHELTHVVQQNGKTPIQKKDEAKPEEQGQESISPTVQKNIQKAPEPAKPKASKTVDVPFASIPENEKQSDPTGGTHGIQIERKGDDLYYHLPAPTNVTHLVPKPVVDTDKSKKQTIKSITWGGSLPYQTAFRVTYGEGVMPLPYTVNVHGKGSYSSLISMFLRAPSVLTVEPGGLERERERGVLTQSRPNKKKYETATRYHMKDSPFSLYLFSSRGIEVVEDATGKILWGPLSSDKLNDLSVTRDGKVKITWNDPVGVVSIRFNLNEQHFMPEALGALKVSAKRPELLRNIRALGVIVEEKGSRFTDVELDAAWGILQRWIGNDNVVKALKANGAKSFKLVKDVLSTGGVFNTEGQVTISGNIQRSAEEQRSVVIHELTHALFMAMGLRSHKRTGKPVPAHVTAEATELHEDSDLGLIDEGVVKRGRNRSKRTVAQWEETLSADKEFNTIWAALHMRYNIGDPEKTTDIRGMDVADESRYASSPRGDAVGHAFDNVNEFVASFVSSTLQYQSNMLATIKSSGSTSLALYYMRLWNRVNTKLLKLGTTNPYPALITSMKASSKSKP